jgi:hypothetical protein
MRSVTYVYLLQNNKLIFQKKYIFSIDYSYLKNYKIYNLHRRIQKRIALRRALLNDGEDDDPKMKYARVYLQNVFLY